VRFDSVEAGESKDDSSAALIFATRFDKDINSNIEATLDYRVQSAVPDIADTNHHLEVILSVDVIGDLDLDLTFVWDRVGDPQPDSSGNRPQRDDFRLFVGLGFSF
jgi:hypothetical protein